MSYLLDTNICIALLKGGDKELVKKIRERSPAEFHLCSVVKAELLYGAHNTIPSKIQRSGVVPADKDQQERDNSQKISANLSVLQKFFVQFQSLPFDDAAVDFYGATRALLTRAGTPIGANDLLIASIAQANGLTVLTRNRSEFIRVPGLRSETW